MLSNLDTVRASKPISLNAINSAMLRMPSETPINPYTGSAHKSSHVTCWPTISPTPIYCNFLDILNPQKSIASMALWFMIGSVELCVWACKSLWGIFTGVTKRRRLWRIKTSFLKQMDLALKTHGDFTAVATFVTYSTCSSPQSRCQRPCTFPGLAAECS